MTSWDVQAMDTDELFDFIKKKESKEVATVLWENAISGKCFLTLSDAELVQMFPKVGQKKAIQALLESCKSQSTGATSEERDVLTLIKHWDTKVADEQSAILRPAKPMKSKSKPILKGHTEVYQLPMECTLVNEQKGIAKYTVGKPLPAHSRAHTYIVMVVGATGAGKTTLINGIANYILGVEFKDKFRFKLIDEGEGSEAHSKTKLITAYTIYKHEGSPFPHTLTIIDTPGFGDTEGLKRDNCLREQIREFFSMGGMEGIDSIHAIGFVTQASMARLTPTQGYIFESILNIFGKDIKSHISLLITFADNKKPKVMAAVEEAKIPFCKSFKFNNCALFPEQGVDYGEAIDEVYWKLGMKSFEEFFKQLQTMQERSLTLTREVLDERQQLENVVQTLQVQMKFMVGKINELKEEEECLKENKDQIAANENFRYTVMTQKITKHDISGTGRNVTNCLKCNFTCHSDCVFANNEDKFKCCAMNDGSCTACPRKCRWDSHVNNPFWFEATAVPEERTYEDLKIRYDAATQKIMDVQLMVAIIETEIAGMYKRAIGLINEVRRILQRLDEIALRPNPLSQVEYIDLLIESEKRQGKEGFMKRIACLKAIRRQAELMTSVQNNTHEGLKEAEKIVSERNLVACVWSEATF